jgi:uncharacterized RDD family membrane protein YckC
MAMITVLKENIPHGPFNRTEIAEKLARGEITPESLAFVEGLSQWTPLRDVLARVDAEVRPPAPPPVASMPIGTGYATAGPVNPTGGMPIGTGYSYAATMQPPDHLVYAGFWLRFVAIVIDEIIISAVVFCVSLALVVVMSIMTAASGDKTLGQATAGILYGVIYLGTFVGRWLYFALQESSAQQATLGKRLMSIQVTDRQGRRIGFGRATARYFGKILSFVIFCIGFMMAGWTQRKQALHDMLADTLVVRKPGV